MFGSVRGSSGGLPGAEGGVHESSGSRGRDGMGEGTKQAWVTRFTQDSWELPVAWGISGRGSIEAEGFHGLIYQSGVVRQGIATLADSFYALSLMVPVVLQRVQVPKWPAAGLHARYPNRANPVSPAEVLLGLRACRKGCRGCQGWRRVPIVGDRRSRPVCRRGKGDAH